VTTIFTEPYFYSDILSENIDKPLTSTTCLHNLTNKSRSGFI